jgi:hypothetical protein
LHEKQSEQHRVAGGRGRNGGDATPVRPETRAYIRFAVGHPSHYRVMFGGFRDACAHDPDLAREANASFQTLVDAIADGQQAGEIRRDDPRTMAVFVWSIVHGVAMLAIDGSLPAPDVEPVVNYAVAHTVSGISSSTNPGRAAP